MKNRLALIVIALLSTSIFACKKFDQQPGSNSYYFRAQKNDVVWAATQGGYLVSSSTTADTLTFFGSKTDEHIKIVTYKNNLNQFKLDSVKTKFYTTSVDAVASSYKLDTAAANKVSLSLISLNQPAAGSFELTFKKVSGDATFPDVVAFKQGGFLLDRTISTSSVNGL